MSASLDEEEVYATSTGHKDIEEEELKLPQDEECSVSLHQEDWEDILQALQGLKGEDEQARALLTLRHYVRTHSTNAHES